MGSERKADDVISCAYFLRCEAFLRQHLIHSKGVKEAYLAHHEDKCFCKACEPLGGHVVSRGSPPERYVLPGGWCRFGVQ